MRSIHKWLNGAIAVLVFHPSMAADELPHKAGSTPESYPGVEVRYESMQDRDGQRLRLIVTRPTGVEGPFPVIFIVGWLSCDSVAAPAGTMDATQLVLRAMAQLPGFATMRMDKPGTGDSEGECGATDFAAELADYRQAFHRLSAYPFVDLQRVFVLGISNGGGFAPLVAEGAPVRGYVVDGGWVKTWFEHMLEIERRRLSLSGRPASELNSLMKSVETLYSAFLLERQPPRLVFELHPELAALWTGDPDHQYGRPVRYYQQLQDLDLMKAWSAVRVPVLALHGEFDWIMSRADIEMTAQLVNANVPGAAQFVELPATGHTFEHYPSAQAAFAGRASSFDAGIARRIGDWLQLHNR